MLSSHRFLCLPLRLPPCTVPCRIVLASPGDRVTCLCHFSLRLFTEVRKVTTPQPHASVPQGRIWSDTLRQISFSFSSRWHCSARKGPYALRPVSQQPPQGCPRNSANYFICLVEHRSFSALGGMSAASFLHSSFLQAINAVMLWPVHVQKVPQASEHLCPAKLQTRCDICCACQSICPFIPTDSSMPRTELGSNRWGWNSSLVVCWTHCPAWCGVGEIFFR